MPSKLGFGVTLRMLFGSDDEEKDASDYYGKTIESIDLRHYEKNEMFKENPDRIVIEFTDGVKISISDEGQSCCEERFITCDDDLDSFSGGTLIAVEVVGHQEVSSNDLSEYYKEICFLKIVTDIGTVTFETHNIHNGYYGGFAITCREIGHEHEQA